MKNDLIEGLCRALAFHLVETELTLQFMDGDASEHRKQVDTAKALIAEAGFDLDDLYPPEDRPLAVSAQ